MATIRFSPSRKPSVRLRALPQRKGLSGAHLLESQPMAGMRQTTEQKIRGGDAAADWVLLVYDVEALKSAVANEPAAARYPARFRLTPRAIVRAPEKQQRFPDFGEREGP